MVIWDEVKEWHVHICTTKCKIVSGKYLHSTRRSVSALCPHRGVDREGEREMQEGDDMVLYVYV